MASHDIPERDWKVFRELREVALDRFCRRALEELEPLRQNPSRTPYERYLDVFGFLQDRDKQVAHAFDDPRRSRMLVQLAAMQAYGLIEPDEIARFTTGTRTAIEALATELA